jgi:Zn-dependent protease with chaperone function
MQRFLLGQPSLWTLSPAPVSRIIWLTEPTAKLMLDAYFLFIVFRLLGLILAAVRTVQIHRTAQTIPLPDQLDRIHRHCEGAFDLAGVRLLFSAKLPGPVTLGRAIILPESLLAERSEDVLTTAIGHEMAHIARRDFVCNFLFELLYLPVSFQPAAG